MLTFELTTPEYETELRDVLRAATRFMCKRFTDHTQIMPQEQLERFWWDHFDASTQSGLRNLFNVKSRKAVCDKYGDKSTSLHASVRFAKEGVEVCTFNVHLAWTATGFGFWAHVITELALKVSICALQKLKDMGYDYTFTNIPHLIMRPLESKMLRTHFDQIPPPELITLLKEHVASSDPSTRSWINKHGMQTLIHLKGGTDKNSGATYTYHPLTPQSLLLVMEFVQSTNADIFASTKASFLAQEKGPYFFDLDKILPEVNRMLVSHDLPEISKVPIVPSTRTPPSSLISERLAAWRISRQVTIHRCVFGRKATGKVDWDQAQTC